MNERQEVAAIITELLELIDGWEHTAALDYKLRERAETIVERIQLDEVQRRLDAAAEAIMAMPIEEWAGWFTYLMEAVETDDLIGFEFVLEVERERINNRLERGRW